MEQVINNILSQMQSILSCSQLKILASILRDTLTPHSSDDSRSTFTLPNSEES